MTRQTAASRCKTWEILFTSFLLLAVLGGIQIRADETRLRDIDKMLQEGRKLSVEQVADLETGLTQNPKDFDARIRLLGYYGSRVDRSAQGRSARDKLEPHVLRLIEHYPGSEIFSGTYWDHAERHVLLDGGNAKDRAAVLWKQAIKENENDAQILGNAAAYFLTYPDEPSGDRDQTEALLRRAQKLDPKNSRWAMDFLWLYVHDQMVAQALVGESKQAVLKRTFAYLEEWYARTDETLKTSPLSADERRALSQGQRFVGSEMPGAAFAARDAQKAKKYATVLLESARQAPNDPVYRDVIHNANVILGWVALREGRIDQAKRHLREAGKLPRSFGPNIELALELLKKGIAGNGAPKAGAIVFTSSGDYDVGDFPLGLVAGDLDGDGDIDLAVANRGAMDLGAVNRDSDSLSVLLNRGDGSFADVVNYTVGDQPTSVTGGDFDGDGDLDLAVANSRSRDISVLLNNGLGTFVAGAKLRTGWTACLTSGDLDGDGDLDLGVGGGSSRPPGVAFVYAAGSLLNYGNGTFERVGNFRIGGAARSLSAGDLDGDGDLDLTLGSVLPYPKTIAILMNNGDGTFVEAQRLVLDIHQFVTSGDFDGDGDLDLAVAFGIRHGQVLIVLNDGKGRFEQAGAFPSGKQPFHIATGDLDLDGDLDLAVANIGIGPSFDGDVAVLLNNGDATFDRLGNFPVRSGPRAVTAADLDGDGDLDLATANPGTDTVSVLLNSRVP